MKVYLPKDWLADCIFLVVYITAMVIFFVYSCFWCAGRGIDVLILVIIPCAFIYVGFVVWMALYIVRSLIRYVTKTYDKLVMYSFRGKYLSSLDPKADFYYEILPMSEGMFSCQDYIILSNSPFNTFRYRKIPGLGKVCEALDKDGTQIIMPCKDNPYVSDLLNSPLCHRIW